MATGRSAPSNCSTGWRPASRRQAGHHERICRRHSGIALAGAALRAAGLVGTVATLRGGVGTRGSTDSSEGWSWKTIDIPGQAGLRNLTGFSHGTAGIGWALLELSSATGEARFRSAAEEAFRYERTHYSPEQENWPDFRDFLRAPGGSGPVFGTAWCHGAPGIALSRLRAWGLTASPQSREEAEAAVRTTTRAVQSPDAVRGGFSLCHGCAGNADVLLEAAGNSARARGTRSRRENRPYRNRTVRIAAPAMALWTSRGAARPPASCWARRESATSTCAWQIPQSPPPSASARAAETYSATCLLAPENAPAARARHL